MNINHYIKSKREANDFFHLVKGKLINSKNANEFKNTNEALLNFIYKIENLLEGVISVQNNLYSVYVLYRSLIEHHLIQYYIFIKHIELESDKTGENYCTSLKIYEFFQEMLAELNIDNIINNKNDKDLLAFIRKKHPELKGIEKSNQQDVSRNIKDFNYKSITEHIYLFSTSRIPNGDLFLELIKEYSKASSFTHGGPYSDQMIKLWKENGEITQETLRITGMALSIYINSIRSYIMFGIDDNNEKFILISTLNKIKI